MTTSDQIKHVGDGLAATGIVASWVELLPAIAAGVSIIWFLIRIWETDTIRGLTNRKDKRRNRRKDD